MKNRRLKCAVLALAVGSAICTPIAADAAALSPADPNCTVSVSNSGIGLTSFTEHITADPCRYPVRAVIHCLFSSNGMSDRTTHYGATLNTPGSSNASCDITDFIVDWGHQVYYNGVWVEYGGQ